MTLAAGATRLGRKQAELLMQSSAGTVKRKTGVTTDDVTFVVSDTFTTIYTGPGKVTQNAAAPTTSQIPGSVVTDQRAVLSLPFSVSTSGDVRTGDVWEWTRNDLDPSKVGQRLTVAGVQTGTFLTARRFPLEETS